MPAAGGNFGNLGFATITAKSQNLDDFAPITATFKFSRNGFCHNNCRAHFQILGSGPVFFFLVPVCIRPKFDPYEDKVRSICGKSLEMEKIQEIYGREMYHFGSPNHSYNKEKRCVGTAKGVLFSGAPNGATKAIKPLILVVFAAKRRKNYRMRFFV